MRVLVVGGGGFLGSELVSQLSKSKDVEVAILDSFTHGFPEKMPKKRNIINPIVGNIRNFYDVSRSIEKIKPDMIVHLAAFITRPENVGDFRKCAEINYVGTANLLEACVQVNKKSGKVVKKIIFASCEAARNPQSNFGISKLAAEKLLESVCPLPLVGIDLAILRFAEIFGCSKSQTSGSMINFLVDHMLVGDETGTGIGLFGVKKKKDHVHISDAVKALLLAIEDIQNRNYCVDIGNGCGITIQSLAENVRTLTGFKGPVQYFEDSAVRVVDSISDTEQAKELLGFDCTGSNFQKQLEELVRKRRKDLR